MGEPVGALLAPRLLQLLPHPQEPSRYAYYGSVGVSDHVWEMEEIVELARQKGWYG